MLKQNFNTLKVKTTSFKFYLFGIILYRMRMLEKLAEEMKYTRKK